jgi:hypothetical protein
MRKSTTCLFILSVAIVVAALMSVGIAVSAQNANSSTTMAPQNGNSNRPKTQRRGRRGRAPKTATAESTPTMTPDTTATMPMPMPAKRTGRCDPNQQEQTDLSGTYTGKLKHGTDPVADATLTITGNNFTGTMGSQTVSGRLVAVTTCGYTAVTIMHEGQPRAMSLRAKRMGSGGLTLMSVPGEPEQIMFTTGGGMMRPRKHRMTKKPVAPPPPTKTTP